MNSKPYEQVLFLVDVEAHHTAEEPGVKQILEKDIPYSMILKS